MHRNIAILIISIPLLAAVALAQDLWVAKDGSIKNPDARALIADRGELYLATRNAVYRSDGGKEGWRGVFHIRPGGSEIRCLGGSARCIYVGTSRGLLLSRDRGATWRDVFRTFIPDKNEVHCLFVAKERPETIVIGTKAGVYVSSDAGARWTDISANLKNMSVACIMATKEGVYAGTDGGLYLKKEGADGWERIIVKNSPEKPDTEEPEAETEYEEVYRPGVRSIAAQKSRLYVGIGKEIVYSDDRAKTWTSFPGNGLAGEVNYILPRSGGGGGAGPEEVYCATTKGVFEYNETRGNWRELYNGIAKHVDVAMLTLGEDGESALWAVTDRGVYRLETGRYFDGASPDIEKSLTTLKTSIDAEPDFRAIQRAAIHYAEVEPEKIERWRREARLKAFVPRVSLNMDRDRSTNTEIYTSATRDYAVVGPDDHSDGWGVSVAWELADLIWSVDQTSIDVRSRLMVQLRNDILDDLRRVYYERKRLQFELFASPPSDMKARFEKELRLQELTQAIDDLTGNYLSEHYRKGKECPRPS